MLNKKVISRIENDNITWEQEPLKGLAKDGELGCYKHTGFWRPMDTLRDQMYLDQLWNDGLAPWKVWN